jgi:4-hydroxy-4-methyl-2-oxoglutarate aldolase
MSTSPWDAESHTGRLSHGQLLELKRWNTPTVYNGWEQITRRDRTRDGINLEETRDFMPQMGVMVGYAVTLVIEPSNREHRHNRSSAWSEYRQYVASRQGPKIVIVQDLDKPRTIGSFWGEVNANAHRALGCVGTITDGAVRDLQEMTNAGFKAIARRLCVGHAWACPVKWGGEVEVFGQTVQPGQLVHVDQHGFLAMTAEEESQILDAVRFMDSNECTTLIAAVRNCTGLTCDERLKQIEDAAAVFTAATRKRFGGAGE